MNEKSLIQQAQQGSTNCFSQLVQLYQARLYHYLLARCHNAYDAEDVLQDSFISAYKYIHSYQPEWQFSTWLFTIANRLIKKQHSQYYQEIPLTLNTIINVERPLEDRDNIWIEIKQILKPAAYDVLWFFYIEQLSIKEIAQIVQHSQSWVKISLFRSKKSLADSQEIQNLSKQFLCKE